MQSPYYAPNFSDVAGDPNDGYAQLYAVENQTGQYYSTTAYPLSYADYKASTLGADYLASAWMYNYERPNTTIPPGDPGHEQRRRNAALYWFDVLRGVTPGPPKHRKMPLLFYVRNPLIR